MSAGQRHRMPEPTRPFDKRGLQRRRSRLLVQGFRHSSEAAESAAEAKAADADVGAAGRLQGCAERARREAIDRPKRTGSVSETLPKNCIRWRTEMKKIWPLLAALIFVTAVKAQTPYAGMQTRSIKALSDQQIA